MGNVKVVVDAVNPPKREKKAGRSDDLQISELLEEVYYYYSMAFGTRKFIASSTQAFHRFLSRVNSTHEVFLDQFPLNPLLRYLPIRNNFV